MGAESAAARHLRAVDSESPRPLVQGVEGIGIDGRPTFTLPYRRGKVVFQGLVAEAASVLLRLPNGRSVSKDLLADYLSIDQKEVGRFVTALSEGLALARSEAVIESNAKGTKYFLTTPDKGKIPPQDDIPYEGELTVEITAPGKQTIIVEEDAAAILAEVRGREFNGHPTDVDNDEVEYLRYVLSTKKTGIEVVTDYYGEPVLQIPRRSTLTEVWTIDLGDEREEGVTARALENFQEQHSGNVVVLFPDRTGGLLIDETEHELVIGGVDAERVQPETNFQQWLLSSVRPDVARPEPVEVYASAGPFELSDNDLFQTAKGLGVSLDPFSPGKQRAQGDAGLSAEIEVSRVSVLLGEGLAVDDQIERTVALQERVIGKTRRSREQIKYEGDVLSTVAKEVAASAELRKGLEVGEFATRYANRLTVYIPGTGGKDSAMGYYLLLNGFIPEPTETGRHRPEDIVAIFTLMDYLGQLTPEQQAKIVSSSKAAYQKALTGVKAQERARAPQRVTRETFQRRVWGFDSEIARDEALQLGSDLTAAEIEMAFPEFVGFQKEFAGIIAEPGEAGMYHPSIVVAMRALRFYGEKLYPNQRREVVTLAEKRWEDRKAEESGTTVITDKSLMIKLGLRLREVNETGLFSDGATAEAIVAVYPELEGFEEEFGEMLPSSGEGGIYPTHMIAAIRVLKFYGTRVTGARQTTFIESAQMRMERDTAEANRTNLVSQSMLDKRIRAFVGDTAEYNSIAGGTTAAKIEAAFPETRGFRESLVGVVIDLGEDGIYPPAVIVGIRTLMNYGAKLTSEQQGSVVAQAESMWDRRITGKGREKNPNKVKTGSAQERLRIIAGEVAGVDAFSNGATAVQGFGIEAYGFLVNYAHLFSQRPSNALFTQAEIAAGRCLLYYQESLTLDQQQRIIANAQPTLDRWRERQQP